MNHVPTAPAARTAPASPAPGLSPGRLRSAPGPRPAPAPVILVPNGPGSRRSPPALRASGLAFFPRASPPG